ncbi:MAG TPA: hypothetical protein P5256_18215 [Beijerinckiaceae bacterium]|nr:hypothetical protein [Hyphomicrobiales bacterium]MCO5085987.1 hypothetical protein [Methylobacteriaceae bacterium]HRY05072.1 hypothetical protein [Beijerinckiaceae bacterium]
MAIIPLEVCPMGRHDFVYYLMHAAVAVWTPSAAILVWGWPCLARLVMTAKPQGVFGIMLPRGVSFFIIIVSLLMMMVHVLSGAPVDIWLLLCLAGMAATVWMRSALRRQVSP